MKKAGKYAFRILVLVVGYFAVTGLVSIGKAGLSLASEVRDSIKRLAVESSLGNFEVSVDHKRGVIVDVRTMPRERLEKILYIALKDYQRCQEDMGRIYSLARIDGAGES